MKYIKQLDSFRAIAVLLVIIGHWLSPSNILNTLPNGVIGVDMFFVLSGFLITTILFKNRNIENITNGKILKTFYARRTLRIFPIYYLTIFSLLAISEYTATNIKSDFIYYATYTSNFNFFLNESWDGMLSHMWSLAVEEQFYLIWPWIILFTKKKHLLYAISIFILIGIGSRFYFSGAPLSRIVTTSCFDSFGVGALLSWFIVYRQELLHKFYSVIKVLSLIIISCLIFGFVFLSKSYWFILPAGTINSILSLWIIAYIYVHKESGNLLFKFFLNSPILIFIGKISYGIYIYHNLLPKFSGILREHLMESTPVIKQFFSLPYSVVTVNFILVIAISWISFRLIESPFLRLKKYFSVDKSQHIKT